MQEQLSRRGGTEKALIFFNCAAGAIKKIKLCVSAVQVFNFSFLIASY